MTISSLLWYPHPLVAVGSTKTEQRRSDPCSYISTPWWLSGELKLSDDYLIFALIWAPPSGSWEHQNSLMATWSLLWYQHPLVTVGNTKTMWWRSDLGSDINPWWLSGALKLKWWRSDHCSYISIPGDCREPFKTMGSCEQTRLNLSMYLWQCSDLCDCWSIHVFWVKFPYIVGKITWSSAVGFHY